MQQQQRAAAPLPLSAHDALVTDCYSAPLPPSDVSGAMRCRLLLRHPLARAAWERGAG